MQDAHVRSTKEVLERFQVDSRRGLSSEQVKAAQEMYGRNELPEEPSTPLWELILEQFKDQLVIILLMAAGISFVLAAFEDDPHSQGTAYVEPIVILLILIANATVGVIQESNAEKAIEALKEYSPDFAKVVRSGKVHKIPAVELVPGDIVEIAVGDRIPADCRLLSIESSQIRVDQAILTGESVSIAKITDPVPDTHAVKQDMINMLFSGTTVVLGKCHAVVVKIGAQTAIGAIHHSISSQISEKTPLKKKLDDFGDMLAKVISVICVLVWLVNFQNFAHPTHGGWLKGAVYYFKIAVALAVAAIPEGLAVVITTCLALGTRKMAKKNAIVRSLPSVETLGCTSVICSDKTGTLTTNQMSVQRVAVFQSESEGVKEYHVEGTSFSPFGSVTTKDGAMQHSLAAQSPAFADLVQICSVCNDAQITYTERDGFKSVGEPTEAALKTLVEKIGTDDEKFNHQLPGADNATRATACNDFIHARTQRLLTFEFSRDRKSMSVLAFKSGERTASLLVKGAPESVLDRCTHVKLSSNGSVVPMTPAIRATIDRTLHHYANDMALRCLAFAIRTDLSANVADWTTSDSRRFAEFEQDMTFVGLTGMQDPPRPEVAAAIRECKTAGIRVIVITGDNQDTAEAICRSIGIFGPKEDISGLSYTGRQFDQMSQVEKVDVVRRARLFSRTEPTHKSELVDLLQSDGEIVAMTGDGVNDAPALKKADIGVAMGSGTDVARLAADMVLADDNFATIEGAVEEGRAIYNNTKQFIRYLISSNIGEVVSIFLTVLLGMPEALIPVQLLWVNLVTDGLPATALGFNPPDHDIMRQPPRDGREPIVGPWLFLRYMIIGIYVGGATVFGYAWWFMYYAGGPRISYYQLTHFHDCATAFPEIGCAMFSDWHALHATSMSLSILVVIEMFNAMNSLSENESLTTLPLWNNMYLVYAIILSMALHFMILYVPFFTSLFAIAPLGWTEWKAVLLISFPVILIDEGLKWISRTYVSPATKLKVNGV